MNVPTSHYLLFSDSSGGAATGHWRFVLRATDGSRRLAADDIEPDVRGGRLALLAVVRGLEALDAPCRVTLVTPSRYVRAGIRFGLNEWRKNEWRWEYFGQMVPIKNSDLWQRVDRAMQFHDLECRNLRFDFAHEMGLQPTAEQRATEQPTANHAIPGIPIPDINDLPSVSCLVEANTVQARSFSGKPHAKFTRQNERRGSVGGWYNDLSLGRLFGLVKLLRGNRLKPIGSASVCKEV